MSNSDVYNAPIAILGAGAAGLINAHILLEDGFTNVTLITRDKTVGGTWARDRIYPGLIINNVYGIRFSMLNMLLPENTELRISGLNMCDYLETFSTKFLIGKANFKYETEILNVARVAEGRWQIKVLNGISRTEETLSFSRVILATGGCSEPKIPPSLSQEAADKVGFKGLVLHSSQFASKLDEILTAVRPGNEDGADDDLVLAVGGGRSAQDICTKLTLEGRKTAIVFESTDTFVASPTPAPDFARKSRLLGVLSPHRELNTRLERFLHTTTIGSKISKFVLGVLEKQAFDAYKIPRDSPLRNTQSFFWSVRLSDEGAVRPDSFRSLALSGKIELITPVRVQGYSDDGGSVILSNGQSIRPRVVVVCTGYQSSWSKIFTSDMATELGIDKHAPTTKVTRTWNYLTLQGGPKTSPENEKWTTSIYRGLVPANNILRRDFAIAGALFTGNAGYMNEVVAHWISSYFQGDKMRLPASPEEAVAVAEEQAAWMKVRYPDMSAWANESYSTSLDFLTYPQAADELLEDMYLPSMRTGGNWFTWVFKPIDVTALSTVGEERRNLRLKRTSPEGEGDM